MEPLDTVRKAANVPQARRALGRGLDALLPAAGQALSAGSTATESGLQPETVREVSLAAITPNRYQPRRQFREERLRELADSIRLHGILQPIVVRKQGDSYELIAGERRWRAANLAGAATVPAIVRDVPDERVLELTLIENIQREDLNPIEVAEALARLGTEANLTHEQIAERTGKDRVSVTNSLRLLKLPKEVQERIAGGAISVGHAKALMTLSSEEAQKTLAARVMAQGLSVRQTEELAREQPRRSSQTSKTPKAPKLPDPNVRAAVLEMERSLGTRVRVEGSGERGRIVIEYQSAEDLDRIYARIVPMRH